MHNIIMMGSGYLDKFDSTPVQPRKGTPHFHRDYFVRFAVKDVERRNLFLQENRFQGSHVVEPVAKKRPQRDADLCANHIVHGGEGRNQQNLLDDMFRCELEGGSTSERVSQDRERAGVKFPSLLLQKSLERALRV